LSGWLAVDHANRQMLDVETVEKIVNEQIESLREKAEEMKSTIEKTSTIMN